MEKKDWNAFIKEKEGFAREIQDELRSQQEEEWRRLAGPHYEKMMESRQAAEDFLQHEDRDVRLVALRVLTFVWWPGPEEPLATTLYMMAFEGNDQEIREAALCAFVVCHKDTRDPHAGRLLAEIVIDESQRALLRWFAYRSLYTLQGESAPSWPGAMATPPTMLRVPEDIHWDYVKSFLPPEVRKGWCRRFLDRCGFGARSGGRCV